MKLGGERLYSWFDWLLPQTLRESDVESLRQGRTAVGLSLWVALNGVGLQGYALKQFGVRHPLSVITVGIIALGILNIFLLRQTRSVRLAGVSICLQLVLGQAAVGYYTGGLYSIALLWNVFVPLIAMFIVGWRWGWACFGLVVFQLALFLFLHKSGFLPAEPPWSKSDDPHIQRFVPLLIIALFGTIVSWLFESSRARAATMVQELHQEKLRLATAKDAAETSNQLKNEFLATMSHELRTPLNAILGYSELLEDEAREQGHDVYLHDLARVQDSGKALLQLVDDVLDLAMLESKELQPSIEACDIPAVLEKLECNLEPLLAKNGNALEIELDPQVSVFWTDTKRLTQMLFNLLSNAAKFTHQGHIYLRIRPWEQEDRQGLAFEVEDTGIGIAPERIDALFEPFTLGDASPTRKYGGTGLGLTLTKRLCQLLQGEIQVHSQPGQGSNFTLRLPNLAPPRQTKSQRVESSGLTDSRVE